MKVLPLPPNNKSSETPELPSLLQDETQTPDKRPPAAAPQVVLDEASLHDDSPKENSVHEHEEPNLAERLNLLGLPRTADLVVTKPRPYMIVTGALLATFCAVLAVMIFFWVVTPTFSYQCQNAYYDENQLADYSVVTCNCRNGSTYLNLANLTISTFIALPQCATPDSCSWGGINPVFCAGLDLYGDYAAGYQISIPPSNLGGFGSTSTAMCSPAVNPSCCKTSCSIACCLSCPYLVLNDPYISSTPTRITGWAPVIDVGVNLYSNSLTSSSAGLAPLCGSFSDVVSASGVAIDFTRNSRPGSFDNFLRVVPLSTTYAVVASVLLPNRLQGSTMSFGQLVCDLEYICQGSVCAPSGKAVCFTDLVNLQVYFYNNTAYGPTSHYNFSLTDRSASWQPNVVGQRCCAFYQLGLFSSASVLAVLGSIGGVAGIIMAVFRLFGPCVSVPDKVHSAAC
eukprot:gnl/Spiro4/15150_TR8152_c0_g1_i1.p1 gnl/Spiro4/15150_TR8152_c0_g1~~gnl/Spiro4/15150_TR8152_c0_g1_i1.p1  ORF type:complete len:454 (-),score=41.79 gnl/Spiro4/15150_TR8152_c0_g1_i1:134-1495(-)